MKKAIPACGRTSSRRPPASPAWPVSSSSLRIRPALFGTRRAGSSRRRRRSIKPCHRSRPSGAGRPRPHVDAGEIESRLVRRHREQRLVDHLTERPRGDPDPYHRRPRPERKLGKSRAESSPPPKWRPATRPSPPCWCAASARPGRHLARSCRARVQCGGAALRGGGSRQRRPTSMSVSPSNPTVARLDQHMGKNGRGCAWTTPCTR
jgi:hypothetical protein